MSENVVRFNLTAVVIAILIPAFVGVSLINYYVQKESIREEVIHSSLPLVRDLINWEIETRLKRPLLAASMMASDTFLKEWISKGEQDVDRITEYLSTIRDEHKFSSTFLVSWETGNYYSYLGLHKQMSPEDAHDIWYYTFLESGLEVDLDVDTDEVLGELLTVFINQRLTDRDGRLLGVTGVGLDMSDITGLLQTTQQKYGRVIYLVDETGTVQAHSDYDRIEKDSIRTMPGIAAIADKILVLNQQATELSYTRNGHTILLTSRFIDGVDWYIIVEQDEAQLLGMAVRNLIRTIAIGLAASLLIILISIHVVNGYQRRITALTATDHLTGLHNRMHLDYELNQEYSRFLRYGTQFSIIMIDLDFFKEINDAKGHTAGDTALQMFATVVSGAIRATDRIGRWGGDEFLLILTDTDGSRALQKAEQLRKTVEQTRFQDDITFTISCGVAAVVHPETLEDLIQRADAALYAAKAHGRNRVVLAKLPTS